MLSDRPYMRDDYQREKTSVLTWLISAIAAGFIIQLLLGAGWLGPGGRVNEFLGLTTRAIEKGWLWTLLTHGFLHSPAFIVHGIFNMLALYFLGRELLPMLGARRFLGVFAAATVIGGLAWTAAHWASPTAALHIGATAAVYGLFTIFACFFPNQQINFLLFFVFPIAVRPKHVAIFLAGFSLVGLLAYEIPGNALPLGMAIASSAHLGGMLTGFVYYRFIHDSRWVLSTRTNAEMELPRWLTRTRKSTAQVAPEFELNLDTTAPGKDRENIRAEIDRILDKINSHGFGALTVDEKRRLDEARDLLSRR